MKKLLLFIGILIPTAFYAQSIKQYSGDFDDGTTQHGKATYSYYEKNDERIKHGSFSYTRSIKSNEGSFNSSISGSFKNNLKDGNWTYTINFTDWGNGNGYYNTGAISLTSNYINGLPNGQWIYSENSKSRTKNLTFNGYTWSAYTTPVAAKTIVNFKNGVLNGNFQITSSITNMDENWKATFDEKGYCIKSLTKSFSNNETNVDYYKNTMIKMVSRNKSTGEVEEKTVLTPEEIAVIQKYSDGQISAQELMNFHLKIDTVKPIKLENFETNIYRSSFFLNEYLKGDKVFDGSFDFGGYYIYTTKFELKKLSDIENFKFAEESLQEKNTKGALSRFENVKGEFENNLSNEDLTKLNARIAECNNLIEEENIKNKQKTERAFEWGEIERFRTGGATLSDIQSMLDKAKTFQEKYKNYLTENDKNLTNYNSSINPPDANNDKELVEEKIKYLEKVISISIKDAGIEKENAKVLNEQKKQDDLKKEFDRNTEIIYGYTGQFGRGSKFKAVEDLYIVRDAGNNITKTNKKHLYNAYEIAKKDLEEKRNGFSNDLQKAIDTGNVIITLCDKMISLANENTDELETKIKKEKDPQKILKILGL